VSDSPPAPDAAVPSDLLADLRAAAADHERDGVTRVDTDRLAAAGLYATYGPPELGGADPAGQRLVAEALSGASPDLWFVWYQHGPVVRMLAASANEPLRDRLLPGLCSGELQGGVSFSHLRTPRPSIHAERVEGGWLLDGRQPWCTGWGISDVVLAGALVPATDEVVLGLVPAGDRPELTGTGALDLAAMGGTSTSALRFSGLHLADEDVVVVRPRAEFEAADRAANTNVQPSTFGVALAALDLLTERAPDAEQVLRARLLDVRQRAYRLLDEVAPDEALDERLAVRAEALLLAMECTTALLTARGGQGMGWDDPAQRLLRAAAFQVVHSQAAHIRAATLAALAR
jgi:alkylation response protein AidB-like acyl-CoA dehydrogenase